MKKKKMTEEEKFGCALDIFTEVAECIKLSKRYYDEGFLANKTGYDLEIGLYVHFAEECRDKAQVMRDAHGYDVSDTDMLEIAIDQLHGICDDHLSKT